MPKITMGTRNNFSGNYGQFGHVVSKRLASAALGDLKEISLETVDRYLLTP
jgi:hypothetical protein